MAAAVKNSLLQPNQQSNRVYSEKHKKKKRKESITQGKIRERKISYKGRKPSRKLEYSSDKF